MTSASTQFRGEIGRTEAELDRGAGGSFKTPREVLLKLGLPNLGQTRVVPSCAALLRPDVHASSSIVDQNQCVGVLHALCCMGPMHSRISHPADKSQIFCFYTNTINQRTLRHHRILTCTVGEPQNPRMLAMAPELSVYAFCVLKQLLSRSQPAGWCPSATRLAAYAEVPK